MKFSPFSLSVAVALSMASSVDAATVGLPIFTTAPSTVHITNQFGPPGLPTPSYTLNLHSTIDTAQGAPELVGQSIDFSWFYNGGFDDGSVFVSLNIGGQEILADPLMQNNQVLISPPYVEDSFDPGTGLATFSYPGIFAGFGPNTAIFPELTLEFALNALIPTLSGFLYCTAGMAHCEFSNTAGLTEIGGDPVTVYESFVYPEGHITNAVMTFSTVNGRPVAEVPLPAGGALLFGALGALGVLRRRARV